MPSLCGRGVAWRLDSFYVVEKPPATTFAGKPQVVTHARKSETRYVGVRRVPEPSSTATVAGAPASHQRATPDAVVVKVLAEPAGMTGAAKQVPAHLASLSLTDAHRHLPSIQRHAAAQRSAYAHVASFSTVSPHGDYISEYRVPSGTLPGNAGGFASLTGRHRPKSASATPAAASPVVAPSTVHADGSVRTIGLGPSS